MKKNNQDNLIKDFDIKVQAVIEKDRESLVKHFMDEAKLKEIDHFKNKYLNKKLGITVFTVSKDMAL